MTMYKNEMKFHMLMFMNAWMMLVLMKCKCQMQCLTLGCYSYQPCHNLVDLIEKANNCCESKNTSKNKITCNSSIVTIADI